MSAPPRMRSHVNWAVLGMLLERPSYGYELHRRMTRRIPADVLDPSQSHVYAALDVLERTGLIEPLEADEVQEAVGASRGGARRRQPKVHYRATAQGGAAFRSWLAEQMRSDPAHGELVRRLALAAGMRRVGLMHELVDAYEDACVREAHALPMASADGRPAQSADVLVERLTVNARRATLDAHMAWLTYARKEIEAFERGEEQGE